MSTIDEIITVFEACQIVKQQEGEADYHILRKRVQRRCLSGKYTARQDEKGTWLILKSSVK